MSPIAADSDVFKLGTIDDTDFRVLLLKFLSCRVSVEMSQRQIDNKIKRLEPLEMKIMKAT